MRSFGRRASQGRVPAMPLYRRLQLQTRQRRQKQQQNLSSIPNTSSKKIERASRGEKVEILARTSSDFFDFVVSWIAFLVFMNFVASWFAFTNKKLFGLLYLISFWNFARLLYQGHASKCHMHSLSIQAHINYWAAIEEGLFGGVKLFGLSPK
ncbi:hypothetical protein L7F22_002903 [Adiantum nelumboides]|nr:hypothetical protein [Adiantum nelumboides]